jgi:hypothetical protein
MDVVTALAALLLKYHTTRVHERYWGETGDERKGRIARIADGDVRACRDVKLARGWTFAGCLSAVVMVEEWESGLERGVHAGEKKGPGGELCLTQINHRATLAGAIRDPDYQITEDEWQSLPGLDAEATYRCALAGAKILMYHAKRCSITFEGDSWWMGARLAAEYHLPSNDCKAIVLPMHSHRGMTYASVYRKLLLPSGGG